MALTLAEALELREAYRQALLAVATGKSYQIGQRNLTRADEHFIEEQFEKYDAIVDQLNGTAAAGLRNQRVVPRDT